MKITIVYDSVFGNTAKVAEAMFTAASVNHEAKLISVNDPEGFVIKEIDFLVVGSPTRGFRPTPAISGFIRSLPRNALSGKFVAAFDTRVKLEDITSKALRFMVKTGGYAGKPILNQLKKKGGKPVGLPEGFFVTGEEGPLYEGEIKRAQAWIKVLISNC
jgi:flavodoxin